MTTNKTFAEFKAHVLSRPDHSKKGSVDDRVKSLCDTINSKKEYVTLSSCSGRIALLELDRKSDAEWIYVSHEKANPDAVQSALSAYIGNKVVEFKQESVILHIATSTLELAQELIDKGARPAGFGRMGIISIVPGHVVVELVCAAHISTPVFDKQVLVTPEYIEYLILQANIKLEKSWSCIDRLEQWFNP